MNDEFYSPSDFKQNTWEFDDYDDESDDKLQSEISENSYEDGGDEIEIQNQLDIAYETYKRVYLWDLDTPISKEDFEVRLREDDNFRSVWGIK